MRARKLIDGASFGPETVKAMGEAFDEAWAEIAEHFGDSSTHARLKLAEAMLSVANDGSTDVAALKAGALQAMAMDYRSGIRPRTPTFLKPYSRGYDARCVAVQPRQ